MVFLLEKGVKIGVFREKRRNKIGFGVVKYSKRSISIGFRVSPEEAYALDLKVNASGITKQDYCTKKVLDEEITVHPNIRVQTYICRYLTELTEQLKRLESIEKNNDVLENIKYLLELIDKMGEN